MSVGSTPPGVFNQPLIRDPPGGVGPGGGFWGFLGVLGAPDPPGDRDPGRAYFGGNSRIIPPKRIP